MLIKFCVLFGLYFVVNAQIPSFGRCPEFDAVPDFNKDRFLGRWYEVERYFTLNEIASKCINVVYEKRDDGRIYVSNYYTSRINNVQRIITGKFNLTGQKKEGRFNIHYDTLIPYDASLVVLDTDYDNYAVMWSCSNIGPVGHTESVWVLMRERIPPGPTLQSAYGVLDKYKISRTFFVQTDQTDCVTLPPPIEATDPTENSIKSVPELILDQKKSSEVPTTTDKSVKETDVKADVEIPAPLEQ